MLPPLVDAVPPRPRHTSQSAPRSCPRTDTERQVRVCRFWSRQGRDLGGSATRTKGFVPVTLDLIVRTSGGGGWRGRWRLSCPAMDASDFAAGVVAVTSAFAVLVL